MNKCELFGHVKCTQFDVTTYFFGMLVSEGNLLMSDVIRAFRKLFPMDGFERLRDASKYIGLDMTYGCESSDKN